MWTSNGFNSVKRGVAASTILDALNQHNLSLIEGPVSIKWKCSVKGCGCKKTIHLVTNKEGLHEIASSFPDFEAIKHSHLFFTQKAQHPQMKNMTQRHHHVVNATSCRGSLPATPFQAGVKTDCNFSILPNDKQSIPRDKSPLILPIGKGKPSRDSKRHNYQLAQTTNGNSKLASDSNRSQGQFRYDRSLAIQLLKQNAFPWLTLPRGDFSARESVFVVGCYMNYMQTTFTPPAANVKELYKAICPEWIRCRL